MNKPNLLAPCRVKVTIVCEPTDPFEAPAVNETLT